MKRDFTKLLIIAASVLFFLRVFSRMEGTLQEGETDLVRSAVKNAALTCYAVEGAYPSQLAYLKERYGLSYDEELYFVRYDAFASNQFPDIRVMERGAQEW